MNPLSPKPKDGFWRPLYRVLQLLLIAYLLIVLAVLIFQRRLIYIPAKMSAEAAGAMAAEHGFVAWTNTAGHVIGWKMPAIGASTASVLVVHGNAGCAAERDYLAQPVHDAADVDVFVLEYPGYGAREGSPDKRNLVAAAEEAFQLLPAGHPKYVVGESLGTGVAAELARNHPAEIAGVALFAPFHNLASVAQKQMPLLPAYFLLLDRFNPAECLQHYHGPVAVVVAGSDEVISPVFGKKLFAGYAGPKKMEVVSGAHHNEITGQPASWWRDVFTFWQEHQNR